MINIESCLLCILFIVAHLTLFVKLDKDGKYPLLSTIPNTSFTCVDRSPGYYADPHPLAQCQVYHMCMEGRHFAYLCPNHTLFHQDKLVCDHWHHVNCTDMERRYQINEKLFLNNLSDKQRRVQKVNKNRENVSQRKRVFFQNRKEKQKCGNCLQYYLTDKKECEPCVSPR